MSSASGIGASQDLVTAFAQAEHNNVRFLKIVIRNEQLVLDSTTPKSGAFSDDLEQLQAQLQDDIPAYVLARLDGDKSQWLAISYVPEIAKIRDKMLYAATRASLTKGLGDQRFVDTLFATSKVDVTPDAYAAHRRHMSAASPLSAREAEMERLRAEERAAGDEGYQGTSGRVSHVGKAVGLAWGDGVQEAVQELAAAQSSKLVLITIDTTTEVMVLKSIQDAEVEDLPKLIPASDPSYAFFAWQHTLGSEARRDIVFIYSCPSASPVKHRMLYSSGVNVCVKQARDMGVPVATKRLETSEPSELDAEQLLAILGLDGSSGSSNAPHSQSHQGFARPKGPARKR